MIPEVPIKSYDGLIFVSKISAAVGIKGFETDIINGDIIIAIYKIMHIVIAASVLIIILVIGMNIIHSYKNKKATNNL